jgi:transcriptional antiterminator NusG
MSNELTTNPASSKANTSIARWYAVQVASSCEKKSKSDS